MSREERRTPSQRGTVVVMVLVLLAVAATAGFTGGRALVKVGDLPPARPAATLATPEPTPASLGAVARNALSRTVTIEGLSDNAEEFGTGWLLDDRGDFVTNAHVIASAKAVRISDRRGTIHTGRVMGVDRARDIAVVRATGGFDGTPLPIAAKASQVGDSVVALASSRATGHSDVTVEQVKALSEKVSVGSDKIDPGQAITTTSYTNMVEIGGSKIFPGNSGGPMLNHQGQVTGIVTLAGRRGALAYAIPIARVIAELRRFASGA